jgi:hypothetical protein
MMTYVYQEYPKWIAGPDVIVQNAAKERCIRRQWSGDIGRAKANALQCSRADALALELAPEILALRARGSSYREIAQALDECGRLPRREAAAGRRGRSCGSCAEPKPPLQPGQLARFANNRPSYSSKLLRQPAPSRLRVYPFLAGGS